MTDDNLAENAELMPQLNDQERFHRTQPRSYDRVMNRVLCVLCVGAVLAAVCVYFEFRP